MGDISSMQFSMDVLNGCSSGCSHCDVPNGCSSGCSHCDVPNGCSSGCSQCDVPNGCSRGCSQCVVPNGCSHGKVPRTTANGVHPRVRVWLPAHLQLKILDFAHAACEAQIGPNLPLSSLSLSPSLSLSRARRESALLCRKLVAICVLQFVQNRYYHHSHGRLWRRHCRLLRASTSTTSGSTRTSWSFRKNNSRNSWLRRRRRKTVWSSCLWITTTAHIE